MVLNWKILSILFCEKYSSNGINEEHYVLVQKRNKKKAYSNLLLKKHEARFELLRPLKTNT